MLQLKPFFTEVSERKAECNHQVHKMLVTRFLPSEDSHKGWSLASWAYAVALEPNV